MSGDDNISIHTQLYLKLLETRPRDFVNGDANSIQIELAASSFEAAEQSMAWTIPDGHPSSWMKIGVHYADTFYSLLKDAVVFPDGTIGTYIRLLPTDADAPGVAILPEDHGRFVLIRQYRHATREYHWAIPRGFGTHKSSPRSDAERELKEELGCEVISIDQLGSVHPDTGILGMKVHLFHATITGSLLPQKNEGISEILRVTREELLQMVKSDQITDSFTIAAFTKFALLKPI